MLSQFALYNALSSGEVRPGIVINVGFSPTAPAHGITFWGAEFDEEKKLTALWVTDSDDNILNKADSDSAAVDLGLFKVNVEITEQGYYLSDYWYEDARYIDALTVPDATQTDGWKPERVYLTRTCAGAGNSHPQFVWACCFGCSPSASISFSQQNIQQCVRCSKTSDALLFTEDCFIPGRKRLVKQLRVRFYGFSINPIK